MFICTVLARVEMVQSETKVSSLLYKREISTHRFLLSLPDKVPGAAHHLTVTHY